MKTLACKTQNLIVICHKKYRNHTQVSDPKTNENIHAYGNVWKSMASTLHTTEK